MTYFIIKLSVNIYIIIKLFIIYLNYQFFNNINLKFNKYINIKFNKYIKVNQMNNKQKYLIINWKNKSNEICFINFIEYKNKVYSFNKFYFGLEKNEPNIIKKITQDKKTNTITKCNKISNNLISKIAFGYDKTFEKTFYLKYNYVIPDNIEVIENSITLNKKDVLLPSGLKLIIFNNDFNKNIKYPNKLFYIKYGDKFNCPIDNLPSSVEFLLLGNDFNQELNYLPSGIKYLRLGENFKLGLDDLPNSIESLFLTDYVYNSLNNLPRNLKHFINMKNSEELENILILDILGTINSEKFYKVLYKTNYIYNVGKYEFECNYGKTNVCELKQYLFENNTLKIINLPKKLKVLYLGFHIKYHIDELPENIEFLKIGFLDGLTKEKINNIPKLKLLILFEKEDLKNIKLNEFRYKKYKTIFIHTELCWGQPPYEDLTITYL